MSRALTRTLLALGLLLAATAGEAQTAWKPLQIIYPRAGMNANSRHLFAYPGLPYNVRPAAAWGVFPYADYELNNEPAGMTVVEAGVGQTCSLAVSLSVASMLEFVPCGEIRWPSPDNDVADLQWCVTDTAAMADTECVTWSIDVTNSSTRFVFVDADAAGGGTGTFASPWNELSDAFSGSTGNKICYFKGDAGTSTEYTLAGITTSGRSGYDTLQVDFGSGHCVIWLAYGDDEPVFDFRFDATATIALVSNTSAIPTVVTTVAPHGLTTGDNVRCYAITASAPVLLGGPVTVTGASTFTVAWTDAGGSAQAPGAGTGGYCIEDYPYLEMTSVNIYIDGIEAKRSRNKMFHLTAGGVAPNSNCYVVRRSYLHQAGPGVDGGNGAFLMTGAGAQGGANRMEGCSVEQVTFDNSALSVANRVQTPPIKCYQSGTNVWQDLHIIETETGLEIKGDCHDFHVRTTYTEGNDAKGSVHGNMHNESAPGVDTHGSEIEFSYNYSAVSDLTFNALEMNQDGDQGPVYAHHNTLRGDVFVRESGAANGDDGPFTFGKNVIENTLSGGDAGGDCAAMWLTCSTVPAIDVDQVVDEGDNVFGDAADNIIDALGVLQGAYLTMYGPDSADPRGHMFNTPGDEPGPEPGPSTGRPRFRGLGRRVSLPADWLERATAAAARQPALVH